MAEEESDQEAERLGEELVAIVEAPPGPAGPRAAGGGRGGGGGGGISSRDYCRRFCQVSAAAAPPVTAPGRPARPRPGRRGAAPQGCRAWARGAGESVGAAGGQAGSPAGGRPLTRAGPAARLPGRRSVLQFSPPAPRAPLPGSERGGAGRPRRHAPPVPVGVACRLVEAGPLLRRPWWPVVPSSLAPLPRLAPWQRVALLGGAAG